MNNQPEFTTRESLLLINEMIGKARRSYTSKGTASIVWGVLIMFCGIFEWAEIQFDFKIGFDIWLLLIAALIPQIYYGIKEKRSRDFIGHDEHTILFVWIAYSVCIFITNFYSAKFGDGNSASLIMILFGMPTFIIGGIFKLRAMIFGGVICWILSLVSMYTTFKTDMLLMAACALFAWIIPGIILLNRNKKEQLANV